MKYNTSYILAIFVCFYSCIENKVCDEIRDCTLQFSSLKKTDFKKEAKTKLKLPIYIFDTILYTYEEIIIKEESKMNDFIDYYNTCSCLNYKKYCNQIEIVGDSIQIPRIKEEYLRETLNCAKSKNLNDETSKKESKEVNSINEIPKPPKSENEMNIPCESVILFEACTPLNVCFKSNEILFTASCEKIKRLIVYVNSFDGNIPYKFLRFVIDNDKKASLTGSINLDNLPITYRKNISLSISAQSDQFISNISVVKKP